MELPLWSILAVFVPISLLFALSPDYSFGYVLIFDLIVGGIISLVYLGEFIIKKKDETKRN